ncbi:MAG: TonB family protein [Bryobacter sp.]|nr:TonB family protein [Bryobacter sp.]
MDSELKLELEWGDPELQPKPRLAGALSLLLHLLAAVFIWQAPEEIWLPSAVERTMEAEAPRRKVVPLIAPRFELTQKEANRGPIKQEVNVEELAANLAKQRAPKTFVPPPSPPQKSAPREQTLEAPPQISTGAQQTSDIAQLGTPQLPQIQTAEPPRRNPFEQVGQNAGVPKGSASGAIAPVRKQSLDEIARESARSGQGRSGITVTDLPDVPLTPQTPQNRIGSSLELLSDPQGVDFRPYMLRILAIVKKNWFAVMPESTKFGRRGRTVIQFAIARDGRVPKLVIAGPSGTESLDRAAVAGISASNPFPALPPEFKGGEIRLQFSFSYNMP